MSMRLANVTHGAKVTDQFHHELGGVFGPPFTFGLVTHKPAQRPVGSHPCESSSGTDGAGNSSAEHPATMSFVGEHP